MSNGLEGCTGCAGQQVNSAGWQGRSLLDTAFIGGEDSQSKAARRT